ncbi:MarR family transcriptional regulator [Paenibacillus filicis]|uniref:MarR family transcriptional regulator n=1 Tax=Paenibacillus gyeongsangnamensis TaxID=3388067 RepID=A0ABT4Q531_9BACL|nr:MarR family transcriptional regulator [Paenibacillus filicis]MCZ8511976.1 MarR family transcriptional regulator [Paenibacillus filicis]
MSNRSDLIELEESFRQVFRRAKACWSAFETEGLSASQALILNKLEEEGPLKVSQLAEALYITAGAVTSFSDKLIQGGFAKRNRSDEDRRVVYMEITDKGRAVVDSICAHRRAVTQKFFGKIPEEDVQHLIRIFGNIVKNTELSENECKMDRSELKNEKQG